MQPIKNPLEKAYITQGFTTTHFGHDYGWISFTTDPEIYSRARAIVVESRFDSVLGGGNVVALNIDLPFTEFYLLIRLVHLKSRAVRVGDITTMDQVVGVGGNTGNSTGPHLHYETWIVPKTFTYTTLNTVARRSYAVNPSRLINMPNIDGRKRENIFVAKLVSDLGLPIAKPLVTVRLRSFPGLLGVQLSQYPVLPETGLAYLGKLDKKIDEYEWAALLLENTIVYCATASKDGKTPFIKVEGSPKEVIKEVEKIVEVPKIVEKIVQVPYKDTIDYNIKVNGATIYTKVVPDSGK